MRVALLLIAVSALGCGHGARSPDGSHPDCSSKEDCSEGEVCAPYGQGTAPADSSTKMDQTRHCMMPGEAYPPSAPPPR